MRLSTLRVCLLCALAMATVLASSGPSDARTPKCDPGRYQSPQVMPAILRSSSPGAEVTGLILATHLPVRARAPIKVIWRLRRDVQFRLRGAELRKGSRSVRSVLATWGPKRHEASTFDESVGRGTMNVPVGAEYGSGWTLPTAGCWEFQVVAERSVYRFGLEVEQ